MQFATVVIVWSKLLWTFSNALMVKDIGLCEQPLAEAPTY